MNALRKLSSNVLQDELVRTAKTMSRDAIRVAKLPYPVNDWLKPANSNKTIIQRMSKPMAMLALMNKEAVQDRRFFSFDKQKAPLDVFGRPASAILSTIPEYPTPDEYTEPFRRLIEEHQRIAPFSPGDERLRFSNPNWLLICARRRIRRQVLHALGVAGGKVSKPKYNNFSHVRC